MRPAIDAVLATGTAVAEVALCYTGDLLDPAEDLYTLDYYLRLADADRRRGRAHPRDQGHGRACCAPAPPRSSSRALRERFDLPVHVHTHDTAGGQLATLLAASRAGADAVDVASAPMAGTTSQPSASALVAALAHTERDTGISLAGGQPTSSRTGRPCAASTSRSSRACPGPTGRVYHHEIPGGQLSNLRQQAIALGLADQFELIEDMYAAANRILGRLPKVTPSSKVVGDLALHLAAANADPADFEREPRQVRHPRLGHRLHGRRARRPARRLARAVPHQGARGPRRAASASTELTDDERAALEADSVDAPRDPQPRCCSPRRPGSSSRSASCSATCRCVDTVDYLYGLQPGRRARRRDRQGRAACTSGLEAIGEADDKGMRTVMTTLNGQLRPVFVRDRSITVETKAAEKADASQARPGRRAVLRRGHAPGQPRATTVEAGQSVASIEAMKMEAAITSPVAGVVERLAIPKTQQVDAGDLLVVVRAAIGCPRSWR